jgi:hypothetical protein
MYDFQSVVPSVIRQFFVSRMEFLALVLINVLLVLYVLYVLIIEHAVGESNLHAFAQVYLLSTVAEWVVSIVRTIITADIATMLLWGIIGSIVYSMIVAAVGAFSGARGAFLVAFTYVHPKDYSVGRFILQIILGRLVSVLILFMVVLHAWAMITLVIPYVFNGLGASVSELSAQSYRVVYYMLLFSFAVHILFVLLRLETGRYRRDVL